MLEGECFFRIFLILCVERNFGELQRHFFSQVALLQHISNYGITVEFLVTAVVNSLLQRVCELAISALRLAEEPLMTSSMKPNCFQKIHISS